MFLIRKMSSHNFVYITHIAAHSRQCSNQNSVAIPFMVCELEASKIYNLMLVYCQGWLVEKLISALSCVLCLLLIVYFLEDVKYAIIKNECEGIESGRKTLQRK